MKKKHINNNQCQQKSTVIMALCKETPSEQHCDVTVWLSSKLDRAGCFSYLHLKKETTGGAVIEMLLSNAAGNIWFTKKCGDK